MSKLTKATAVLVLVLYGLASMHCTLEGVAGFGFLKSCCFVDQGPTCSQDCASPECALEEGKYRIEERVASVPQPLVLVALVLPVLDVQFPECGARLVRGPGSPPDVPAAWRFEHRAALPPRAPSFAS